jgi:hypothetical protein
MNKTTRKPFIFRDFKNDKNFLLTIILLIVKRKENEYRNFEVL